jgi:hypothetical protein
MTEQICLGLGLGRSPGWLVFAIRGTIANDARATNSQFRSLKRWPCCPLAKSGATCRTAMGVRGDIHQHDVNHECIRLLTAVRERWLTP